MSKTWRDVNAIYQVYPRSFQDSNGDGIGDLKGFLDRIEYLRGGKDSLGVDAVWFSPFYPSPMADFGYDVSDYCDIHPEYGSLNDFKEVLQKAHSLGIKVMIDFVPNHSSHEHPWLVASKSSRTNDKSDYYVWRDAAADGGVPNNWPSIFGGSAWEWNEDRQQYYLHTFLKEQPDLNWDNPKVREEMKNVLRFWLDIGVDGFRADAVRFMSKDPQFRNEKKNPHFDAKRDKDDFNAVYHHNARYGKNLFPYLREMTGVLKEYEDRIMIFEDYPDGDIGDVRSQYLGFYSVDPEVSMPFNFTGIGMPYSAPEFSEFITNFQGMLTREHIPVYCFSNHDNARIVTRYGEEESRLLALLQMTLPGLPVVYYGDEIGMEDVPIPEDRIQDPVERRKPGLGQGRDPERTPMQWDATERAGFSVVEPWLPVGQSTRSHNVALELESPDSHLALYQRLLKLRDTYEVLRHGDYETFGEADAHVMKFARRLGDQHVYVVLNFSDESRVVSLPHPGRVLCCTHPVDYPDVDERGRLHLRPHEAALVECAEHTLK